MTKLDSHVRDAIQCEYVERIVDGMDMDDLISTVYDFMHESLNKYTEEELLAEIKEYHPDILD